MSLLKYSIKLKRLGKRNIKTIDFTVEKMPVFLKELIEQCVISEVKRLSRKISDNQLLTFMTHSSVEASATEGKVSFGKIQNTQLADETQAIENAIQCFEDGIFLVFIDDIEIKTLDQEINLNYHSEITFLRMTFLTGAYW